MSNPRPTQSGESFPAGDGVLSSVIYRVREFLGTAGHRRKRGQYAPDGKWVQTTDRITRKVWEGYGHRMVLETELKPGKGWRVYMGNAANGDIIGVTPASALPEFDPVTITLPEEPEALPRYPRGVAFAAAKRIMSEFARDNAARFADDPDRLTDE